MGWDYRIIRDENEEFGIYEVGFENGEPSNITAGPVGLVVSDPKDLGLDLDHMRQALGKPILDIGSFNELRS